MGTDIFSLSHFSSVSLSQKSPHRDRRHAIVRASWREGGCAARLPVAGRAGQACRRRARAAGQPAPGEQECGQVAAPGNHGVAGRVGGQPRGTSATSPSRERVGAVARRRHADAGRLGEQPHGTSATSPSCEGASASCLVASHPLRVGLAYTIDTSACQSVCRAWELGLQQARLRRGAGVAQWQSHRRSAGP